MKPYYEHGGITIYHGDCRDVLPSLSPDAIVTDPPFGIGFAAQPTKWQRRAGTKPSKWDDVAAELPVLSAAKMVIWGGNYFPLPISRGWLVWYKPDAPPSMGDVEMAWTNLDQNSKQISHSISATNAERVGHPTQKPLRVIAWSMEQIRVRDGDLIVDPFMGSGTTLRAAKDRNRRAIGIELEERYCEIAARRLEQEVLAFV